jgi:hypothetical protein
MRTYQCTEATKPASVPFCDQIAKVNADLFRAQRIAELRATIADAERVLASSGLVSVKAP